MAYELTQGRDGGQNSPASNRRYAATEEQRSDTSASSDGTVALWAVQDDGKLQYSVIADLRGCITGVFYQDEELW